MLCDCLKRFSNYLDWVPKRQYKGFRSLSLCFSFSLLSLLLSLSLSPVPLDLFGYPCKIDVPLCLCLRNPWTVPPKIRSRRDPQKIGLAFERSLSANAWFVPGRCTCTVVPMQNRGRKIGTRRDRAEQNPIIYSGRWIPPGGIILTEQIL